MVNACAMLCRKPFRPYFSKLLLADLIISFPKITGRKLHKQSYGSEKRKSNEVLHGSVYGG